MKTPLVAAKELYDAPVLTGPDSIYAYRKLSKKEAADQASAFMTALVKALRRIEQSKSPVKVSFLDCCDLYWLGDGWEAHGDAFDGEAPEIAGSMELIQAWDMEVRILSQTGYCQSDTRICVLCLNDIIDKRLDGCRDKKASFNLFDLGMLTADHGRLLFTSFTHFAKEDPVAYAKAIQIHAGDGFTREQGRGISALCPETCKILLKKCKSRLRRRRGGVSGRDTDPFCVPADVKFLDAETLSLLARHRGPLDLSSIQTLDVAGARALSAYEGCTYREVGKWNNAYLYREGYTLGGLTELSEEVAAELSRFDSKEPAWVSELGMSPSTGEYESARIQHDFSGLTVISPDALRHLAKLNGYLSLGGLREFGEEHALALEDHTGTVLTVGIAADAAASLAKLKPGKYNVDDDRLYCGSWKIPIKAEEKESADREANASKSSSADVKAASSSSRIIDLTYDVAVSLSEREGYLNLGSAQSLSDDAAEVLAKHVGNLGLHGLTQLSDSAAAALSKHEGGLNLSGLTSLTDAAADSLSKHEGELTLSGLTKMSDMAADSLARCKGTLVFFDLTALQSPALAGALVATADEEYGLDLNELFSLSDAAAEALAQHEGELNLCGLTELSPKAAGYLLNGPAEVETYLDLKKIAGK
ncbi:hypothetical protein N9496_07290 [Akkermansiaceae bacterium]|nr:hypothetical protein [Akkermansiaceae bacterium]